MAANPYFPLYASDFLFQSMMWDDWQTTVYIKLRSTIWLHGKINASAITLAKIHPMADAFLKSIPEAVSHQFALNQNSISCPDFDTRKAKQIEVQQKKSAAGRKGANTRWKNKKENRSIVNSSSSHNKGIANANAFNEYENEYEFKHEAEHFEGGAGETLKTHDEYSWVLEAYHQRCPNLPNCSQITDGRAKAIKDLLDRFGKEKLLEGFKLAGSNGFLNGNGEKGWKASFDFIIKEDNFIRLMEGQFYSAEVKSSIENGKNR